LKKILIISPHFPPSNLAAVHRARLFAQHLPSFGWKPVILTVHEKYYEEQLDWNIVKLLPPELQIEKVNAMRATKPRLIGDIGLRAFFSLYKKAKTIIENENIDFLYIPIPSFYIALLGRWLHSSTRIPYGIDYIDPWVHKFPGSDKIFSRHSFSTKLARWLEPIAIKTVSLITGVATGYFTDVLKRNPHLQDQAVIGAMPYGGEAKDHAIIGSLDIRPYLFKKEKGKIQFIYAGAMLPKAYGPLEAIFSSIAENLNLFSDIEFHFIGTGKSPVDANGYNVKPLAQKFNLWQTIVYEYPQRIPYLDVLIHLADADAVFILGSTEPHYTPSKTYQAVLSGKPLFAVLHKESTAVEVIKASGAGIVLEFNGEDGVHYIREHFSACFETFLQFLKDFNPLQVNLKQFEQYSAYNVTGKLASLLDEVMQKWKN
jgi:hypothetical protein